MLQELNTQTAVEFLTSRDLISQPLKDDEKSDVRRFRAWLSSCLNKVERLDNDLLTEVYEITPAVAAYILEVLNLKNRNIKDRHCAFIAQEMSAGRWRLTSQGISFSRCGFLNDGQHRLTGCVLANTPFTTLVVFGEDREAQNVLDTGRKREANDVLSMQEIKNSTAVAAAARLLVYYINDAILAKPRISNELISQIVADNPGLVTAATKGQFLSRRLRAAPSALTFAFYLIEDAIGGSTFARLKYEAFVEKLSNGGGQLDHCLILRDGLMNGSFDRGLKDATMTAFAKAAAVIRGWNSYLQDAHLTRKRKTERLSITAWKPGSQFPAPESH